MTRLRYLILIILVNSFLLFVVEMLTEFSSMNYKFQQLRREFDNVVDMSVSEVMMSEEFFEDGTSSTHISSFAENKSEGEKVAALTKFYDPQSASWLSCNIYALSKYVYKYNKLPNPSEVSSLNSISTDEVYEMLFGEVGNSWLNPSLTWANGNTWDAEAFSEFGGEINQASSRTPTQEFKQFYEKVGKQIQDVIYLKRKDATLNSYTVEAQVKPVLLQMGLALDSELNSVNNSLTHDTYTASVKIGKRPENVNEVVSDTNKYSKYYLTPYSLGVTYIPTQVLSTLMYVNLDTTCRLAKSRVSPTERLNAGSNLAQVYNSADGCLDTDIYEGENRTQVAHKLENKYPVNMTNRSMVLNDGKIEFKPSTIKNVVTYFVVDWSDNKNWRIVNELEGYTPNADPKTLPSRLASKYSGSSDTATYAGKKGNKRVVARVETEIQFNIPYDSKLLQWTHHQNYPFMFSDEHIGLLAYETTGQKRAYSAEHGLRYVHTTYVAISN